MPIYTGTIRGTVTDSLGQQVFADLPVNITIEDLAGCASLTSWSIVQTIDAVDNEIYDSAFGYNLDITPDGSVIFMGAPYDESVDSGPPTTVNGAVHVYEFDGVEYGPRTIFSHTTPSSIFSFSDSFGGSHSSYDEVTRGIATNSDGTVVVVGAHIYYDGDDQGAVYLFEWNGTNYVETAQFVTSDSQTDTAGWGEWFGSSVALKGEGGDGSYIFVGSPEEYDPITFEQDGYVHVFKNTGGVWSSIQRFRHASSAVSFGFNMKLSRDGNTLVVTTTGPPARATVFKWNEGLEQMEEYGSIVSPDEWNLGDIAISSDGSRIVYSNGYIPYVAVFDDNGDGSFTEHELTPDEGDWFFRLNVAMCDSGDVVYVAHPWHENELFEQTGALFVYKYNGTTWDQVDLIEGPDEYDGGIWPFGTSISCSADGATVLVGAPQYSSPIGYGRVYVIRGT
jgi:hypothetical protein